MIDWTRTTVSEDGTHHRLDGAPLYDARFVAVLKFHAPGLAPVVGLDGAWHIDVTGCPAYAHRFVRTFGFYEGRAAVVSASGWHHVTPDGGDLSAARHDWCGNFQGGRCAVRDPDGAYYHVDLEGHPLYPERWRYAGDYRDGMAVVQRDDGHSTHINRAGRTIHGQWFLDLDVFHKGFARAQDGLGWMHIDRRGVPLYERRFACVEPFYNGQARVERLDGGREVIDETGTCRVLLRSPRGRSASRMHSR